MSDEKLQHETEEALAETLDAGEVSKETLSEVYKQNTALNDGEIDKIADISASFLRSILSCFGEDQVQIDEYEGENNELVLDISGGDLAVLIGRHGSTLNALQKLLSAHVRKEIGFYFPVHVDVEGYKNRRADAVVNIAHRMADKATKTQRSVHLKPMNAYERRIVHTTLLENPDVITNSEGEGGDRHVVIVPQ